jgi:hypothetical protein
VLKQEDHGVLEPLLTHIRPCKLRQNLETAMSKPKSMHKRVKSTLFYGWPWIVLDVQTVGFKWLIFHAQQLTVGKWLPNHPLCTPMGTLGVKQRQGLSPFYKCACWITSDMGLRMAPHSMHNPHARWTISSRTQPSQVAYTVFKPCQKMVKKCYVFLAICWCPGPFELQPI